MGLTGAESIEDKSIPTFARGELPHYAGINTFLKAPYAEDVLEAADYDATIMDVPFDGSTTYRPGTRFGPQGLRKISALYKPYNYELGVDLREQMTLCDASDVFTIPANIEKSFDQISRAVSHVFSTGSLPIMIGGDHSIGFPCVRGIAECTSKKIGIVHFDRHADIQEKDLDERMHTTPWFHSTNQPNVPAKNLVQVGTASPSFGSRELSYLPFPSETVRERTNMALIYVSMDEKTALDVRDFLTARKKGVRQMKHIAAALAALAPVSAMAHPGGLIPHMHPHGGEIILTLFAVALVGAGVARKFWR